MSTSRPWLRASAVLAATCALGGCASAIVSATTSAAYSQRYAGSRLSSPTPSTSPRASARPSASPTSSPRPLPTPTTEYERAAPARETTILSGHVYYDDGSLADEVSVSVTSLDDDAPYFEIVKTIGGSWVVNNLPVGARIEVMVSDGTRGVNRVVGPFFRSSSQRNIANFGGPEHQDDPGGHRHPLSR